MLLVPELFVAMSVCTVGMQYSDFAEYGFYGALSLLFEVTFVFLESVLVFTAILPPNSSCSSSGHHINTPLEGRLGGSFGSVSGS